MMEEKSGIREPEPFTFESGKWEIWKTRFKRYLKVSGRSGQSEEDKIDLLVYLMGEQAEVIIHQFSEAPKSLESALKSFDEYFYPKKQVGCLRASFNKRVQDEDEPVEKFISDLQDLADECEFGANKDDLVRDRVIAGMCDVELSSQLQLEENLTLKETISIIKGAEGQKKHRQRFSNVIPIKDVVQEPIPSTSHYQSLSRWACLGYQEVSSSTYDCNQKQICFSETLPDNIFACDDEIEGEEGETVSLVYEDFNEPGISSTEETNLKIENIVDEDLSNHVTDSNDSVNTGSSGSSIVVLYEKQHADVIIEDEVQETSNAVKQSPNSLKATHTENLFTSGNLIDDLNDECLLNIFNNLPLRDLIRIERVCKRWQRISLKSWESIKNIDVKNEFRTESIQLEHLEGLLRRSGDYVTSLNCSWLSKSKHLPAIRSMQIISQYCKKLNHLNLCYTWNESNYLHALDANLVRNLNCLNIGSKNFCDDHLPALLKNAANLVQFVIAGYDYQENKLLNLSQKCRTFAITDSMSFSNKMLQEVLQNHPNIENLDISATSITPEALLPFKDQLRALALWDMENFFEADLKSFKKLKCPNLVVLDLSFNDYEITGNILLSFIQSCPAIEDLRLRRAKNLEEKDFKHLKLLKKLMYLDVSYTLIPNSDLVCIARTRKLKKLFCYGTKIKESTFRDIISASPKLRYLAISAYKLTKNLINLALVSLRERRNGIWLTISLRSNSPEDIPNTVEKLGLKSGIDCCNSSSGLRVVYGCSECNCSFEKTCFCSDLEETLICFV